MYKTAAERISLHPEQASPGDIEKSCRFAQAPSPLDYGDYDDLYTDTNGAPPAGDYYDFTGYTENGHYTQEYQGEDSFLSDIPN